MSELETKIVRRLDPLLGLAMTRKWGDAETPFPEAVRYLRAMGFSNGEIAAVLGKTQHHIEVEVSRLVKKGLVTKAKRGSE